jgi:enoyl-CoA hydratase
MSTSAGVASDPVHFARGGPVATVTLNRPQKLNAIDVATLDCLDDAFATIDDDPSIRAVVVCGRGRAFCAGADLDYVEAQMASHESFAEFLERWHRTFDRIERCEKPTVAAVGGFALAGGLELTQVCDVVVAADDAVFGDQHAKFGLFPGGGSTQRLPRLVGRRRATWLLLSGEQFSAAEALAYGMVNRVVPSSDLVAEASAMATVLAERSMSASRAIKRSIREGADLDLGAALRLERALAVEHMLGDDASAGLQAFHARRSPVFAGHDKGDGDV